MDRFRKHFLSAVLFLFSLFCAVSQGYEIKYSGKRGYTLVERTNLRRYVNGKYSGLTSREVRSFISPVPSDSASSKSQLYDGNFYVEEETVRASKTAAAGIHMAVSSSFYIDSDGHMKMAEDNGYPSFRSFPSYTSKSLKAGDSWKAEAERAVDPMNKGVFTRMPVQVLYTFSGEELYKGEAVYRIKALWQTNYGFSNFYRDPKGDDALVKALGGHKADIIVRKATGEAILILDTVDETFFYDDGSEINFKGNITLFTEYPPAVDRNSLFMTLQRVAKAQEPVIKPPVKSGTPAKTVQPSKPVKGGTEKESPAVAKAEPSSEKSKGGRGKKESSASVKAEPSLENRKAETKSKIEENSKGNLVVEETSAGVRLSIRDIKFKADSAELLPGEGSRLDEVAAALKTVPENQFLIEGHTASVGKAAGEQKLSVERAQTVALELSKRGIAADKFICKGYGGTKPVADNATSQGRAQNRRVEITVLE